mgnify:CR=1 FL=1
MSNSKLSPLHIVKATPSPRYYGMWPGMQDAGDGLVTVRDRSGKQKHLTVGTGGTYAAVFATSRYASVVGTAPGIDKALTGPDVISHDIALGQSMILACTINAAAPGAECTVGGYRGITGNIQGVSLKVDPTGHPFVTVRDSGATWNSAVPTNVACDSTDHQIIIAINGTGKKAWGWIDGALWSNMASGQTGFGSGTTAPDGSIIWGGVGDFVAGAQPTWVNGQTLKIRNMHLCIMDYWPANIAGIVAELYRNPHKPLSKVILP